MKKRTCKTRAVVIGLVAFFILLIPFFILYHICLSSFFPVDAEGYIVAPDWYTPLGFLFASIASLITAPLAGKYYIRKRESAEQMLARYRRPGFHNTSESVQIQDYLHDETPQVTPSQNSVMANGNSYLQRSGVAFTTSEYSWPVLSVPYRHSPITDIDSMDGHAFERWCADLLRHNGFTSVEVTRGSGDQGVDILAEKEGIKYAIQCKNYSTDLGNKPIQEVNTGKVIYRCHVAAVMTNRYFTSGGREAAAATGVLLWDRAWLEQHLPQEQEDSFSYSPAPANSYFSQRDELFPFAVEIILSTRQASVSMLTRRLKIGYARAARIIDEMEEEGIVGPFQGSRPRDILITPDQWYDGTYRK